MDFENLLYKINHLKDLNDDDFNEVIKETTKRLSDLNTELYKTKKAQSRMQRLSKRLRWEVK